MSICVIPAKGISRRLPRKNLLDFCGKPMLVHSIDTARASGLFERIIVSTDDDEISRISEAAGAEALIRLPEFCRDEVGTQEVMEFVLGQAGYADKAGELACCLYATAPLALPDDLRAAGLLHALRPCSYVVAVAADPLRDIGNFYLGEVGYFIDGRPLYNTWTGLYVMPPERAIDINDADDLARAEQMYRALHG